MQYTHLTEVERYQIYSLRQVGCSNAEIARHLNRSPSTISREIRRNSGQRNYRPKQAQENYVYRRTACGKKIKIVGPLKKDINKLLKEYLSPEQISGYFRMKNALVSHECIYQYIKRDFNSGGCLYTFLRQSNRKRRKKYGSYNTKGIIKNRIFIDERPKVVDKKARIGDWEVDTVIGKNHKGVLLTIVDRKSKYTIIRKCPNKKSETIVACLVEALKPLQGKLHTITADNGKEFALS